MRTIPEIVAQMRELIVELEGHTGKPAPKQEIPGLDFSLYNTMYETPTYGNYQATDTITLTGAAAQPTSFSLYDIKPLGPNDISFSTKS